MSYLLSSIFYLLLLAPLPWLGDLRSAYVPYLVLVTAATLLHYVAYWYFERRNIEPSRSIVIGVALVVRLAMLPMAPSLSDDVYRYLWDGRLVLHGVNPYHQVPADSSLSAFHDRLLDVQAYPTTNTIYPPGAQLLFAASMSVGGFSDQPWQPGYLIYKALLIGAEMLAIVLLLRLLTALGLPLRRALLYAWHPLPIIELAGQGHTDALWVLCFALALWYYHRGTAGRGLPWLAFGAAVRLFPLLLVPLWVRFLPRRDVLIGALLAVPFCLLLLVLADPIAWQNYSTVMLRFTNFYEFNGGAYYAVKAFLDWLHLQPSNIIAGRVMSVMQLLLLLFIWLVPPRDRSVQSLAWRVLLVVTVQIVLIAKVHIWYFAAPLFLIPLLSRRILNHAWLWAALVGQLTYLTYTVTPSYERFDVVAAEWMGFALLAAVGWVRGKEKRVKGEG